MKIVKFGTAAWSGGIKDGKGFISTESGALKSTPYGFNTRFEGTPGTNPEELLGAAHAGCFTMALSKVLGDAGLKATSLDTKAEVTLEKKGEDFEINAVHLILKGSAGGATKEKFEELAYKAKENCPVSKLFKGAKITLDVNFSG